LLAGKEVFPLKPVVL